MESPSLETAESVTRAGAAEERSRRGVLTATAIGGQGDHREPVQPTSWS